METTLQINGSLLSLITLEPLPYPEDRGITTNLRVICEVGLLKTLVVMGIDNKPVNGLRAALGIAEKYDHLWEALLSCLMASGLAEISDGLFCIPGKSKLLLEGFDVNKAIDKQATDNPSYISYIKQLKLCLDAYPLFLKGELSDTAGYAFPSIYPVDGLLPQQDIASESDKTVLDKAVEVDWIANQLLSIASDMMEGAPSKFNMDNRFSDDGFRGALGATLIRRINETLQITLKATDIFNYPDVGTLAAYIKEQFFGASSQQHIPAVSTENGLFTNGSKNEMAQATDIAIVGMSGQFGSAGSIDAFWEVLREGKCLIEEVPDTRWDKTIHYSPDKNEPGKTYCKWGSFMRDIDKFDPMFFRISGREAEVMDPQHRLFLEQCWKALEDAAINPQLLKSARCGVFVGAGPSDYLDRSASSEPSSYWGNDSAIVASRISYFLDLKGPAVTIDTACSSSLVALDLSCKSLLTGDSDLILTGGVWLKTRPYFYKKTGKARMLSTNGHCYAFDSRANGFVPGEGVGVLVLKRLADAIRDGDQIHGIIKGTLTNQDGATNGITAPSSLAQQSLQQDAFRRFGVHPDTIGYVEAHGTGTRLGDPIEFEALAASFRNFTNARNYCSLGSVKTNIGHTVMAAGVTGVIKVLLSIKHRQLIPSLNYQTINPMIDIDSSPFKIQQELEAWVSKGDHPRRGTVSSFGFSGTNAFAILEEYLPPQKQPYVSTDNAIILLSAKSTAQLKNRAKDLIDHLHAHREIDLNDIAYTLQIGREPMKDRLAIIAGSVEELKGFLTAYLNGQYQQLYLSNTLADVLPESNDDRRDVKTALVNKDRHALARLWVKGIHIDWPLLYEGIKPSKISLPTYPFARERYWSEDQEEMTVGESTKKLHPMLHSNISTFATQRFTSVFSGDEVFLADHQVKGEKVFPGVGYLELVREAGALSTHQKVTQLRNVSWVSPLWVNGVAEQVAVSIQLSGEDMMYEVSTQKNGVDQLHSKGTISTQRISPIPGCDLTAIRNRFVLSKNKAESYGLFKKMGLDYGPGFQGIETLYYREEEALSLISLANLPGVVLSPGMMDSALQTCLGTMMAAGIPGLFVPFRVAEVAIYGELPEQVWSYARKRVDKGSSLLRYDIDLINTQGEIVVQLKDLAFAPMGGLSAGAPVAEQEVLQLLSSVWTSTPASEVISAGNTGSSLILLVGASVRLADELKNSLLTEVEAIAGESEQALFFAVLQKVKQRMEERTPVRITVVVPQQDYTDYGFISGLLKTAGQENPMISGRIIGVESLSVRQLDELITILEKEQHQQESEVRYINGEREARTIQAGIVSGEIPAELKIKEGGVYLITGGAGALGRVFAEYISRTSGTRIILSGRSALSEDVRAAVLRIPRCEYIPCDVSEKEAVFHLIRQIREKYNRLDGVIHSAGLIRDNLILKTTGEKEGSEVLAPKIQGTRNLDEATKEEALDFMVFFSSVVAVTGNAGQAAYTAANAYMDNYAVYRNELRKRGMRQGKTLSINWPYWKEGGMEMQAEHQRYLAREFGLAGMSYHVGLSAFEQALKNGQDQVIVTYGDGNKLLQAFSARQLIHAPARNNMVKSPVLSDPQIDLGAAVKKKILETVAGILKFDKEAIKMDKDLMGYGFDSSMLARLANDLNEYYDVNLPPTVFYNYPSVNDLVKFLIESHQEQLETRHRKSVDIVIPAVNGHTQTSHSVEQATPIILAIGEHAQTSTAIEQATPTLTPAQPDNEPVAIVGISGRFPGSGDLTHFWEQIRDKVDLVTEVPAERWDWREHYGDPVKDPQKTKVKWGGFITDIDKFDALFFEISPAEATFMDPQQRITLEAVYTALEDAGIAPEALKGSDTGVFIGAFTNDYSRMIYEQKKLGVEGQISSGNMHAILANRVSFQLDLHGPSEPIDTACSSSLIAIHRAVEYIRSGRCGVAIAGGVNALLTPETTISISNAGMLSEDGRCKTFDEGANGYVRSEGVGIVVLKRLSQAEKDGDRIYGLIRGTAENHGGKANTLTSPNPQAQKELLLSAYRSANIDPRLVTYIEAHGTGTALGDPIETEGLKMAFATLYKEWGHAMPKEPICSIGSVKANIGHMETAAGMGGVIKVLLSMKHKILPGNPQLITPNKYLRLSDSPFYLQRDTVPWVTQGNSPRIAGVSGFGFGGANAHIILEEYIPHHKENYVGTAPAIILLSAKNTERLHDRVNDLKKHLDVHPELDINDIAYTLQVGREHMKERLAMMVSSIQELKERLQEYLNGQTNNLFTGRLLFSTDEEDVKSQVTSALQNNDRQSLASLWAEGASVAWTLLYPGIKPAKTGLPAYPFARKRHWIPAKEVAIVQVDIRHLHPLLHNNTSHLKAQQYTSLFTGTESFLKDHKVAGEMMLPGVAYLEMAREAGTRSLLEKVTQLRNVYWINPLRFNEKTGAVVTSIQSAGNEITFTVTTQQDSTTVLYSRGGISTQQLQLPVSLPLAAIRDRFVSAKNKVECYQLFKSMGLEYGPDFQGIETLYHIRGEALANIHLTRQPHFVLPPGLLDSALQTCIGTMFTEGIVDLLVPSGVKEVNIYRELPERVWSYARRRASRQEEIIYDIDLLDDAGQVLVEFRSLSLFPLSSGRKNNTTEKEPEEIAQTRLYHYQWVETIPATVSNEQANIPTQIVLLHDHPVDFTAQLSDHLGVPVISLSVDTKEAAFMALLEIIKEKLTENKRRKLLVVYENDSYLRYGFLSGLLKTANSENPQLLPKLIGVDSLSLPYRETIAHILRVEPGLATPHTEVEIRYVNGVRFTKQFIDVPSTVAALPVVKPGGVYLITGGAGGLGKIFSDYLLRIPNVKVIVTGRKTAKEAMASIPPHVRYYQCDISDQAAVTGLISTIRLQYGRLDGVIHSAGVVRDSFIMNKTTADINAVFAPKITGTAYLDEATKDDTLDFMVLFSSVAAVAGNIGQADYAAANAFQDNFAVSRNEMVNRGLRKGRTLSINWPLWADGGMQTDKDSAYYLEKKWGMLPMPAAEGIKAFEALLQYNTSQGVVIYGKGQVPFGAASMLVKEPHDPQIREEDQEDIKASAVSGILSLIAEILSYDAADLNADIELKSYGFNSYMLSRFTNDLNEYYDLDQPPSVFYNYPTVNDLVDFLTDNHLSQLMAKHGKRVITPSLHIPVSGRLSDTPVIEPASIPGNEPIAIVGVSGRFPGSRDLLDFWEQLRDKKDMITEIPGDRWDWQAYYGDSRRDFRKTKAKWGGFITDMDKFDPSFFGITPREAELMDPQQRIVLEAVYAALEDAGIPATTLKGTDTGVFIGVFANDYMLLLNQQKGLLMQAQAATGNTHSLLANRVSFMLDIHGPSEPIDTACSSSLMAIHRAVENIRSGRCGIAIAGGVNAMLTPHTTLMASNAGMLSEDGRCKTFDQRANGYVRAEGVGMLILKSLSQAEKDGDHIYGVVRATAENHGGRANTLTSPNPLAQKDLLLSAYRAADIDPRLVSYIEAHGTGTALGDPIETEALKMAFATLYKERGLPLPQSPACAIGSVKANIGHLESAAGVAGVIKVLLAMKHKILPGNPHLLTPNEYLRLTDSPFYLQRETTPWSTPGNAPRVAGVSSFGFGGVNAHVVLEEYISADKEKYTGTSPAIILLSAKTTERLKARAGDLISFIDAHPALSIHDLAYTLQTGREHMQERMAVAVDSLEELKERLHDYLLDKDTICKGNIIRGKESLTLLKQFLGDQQAEDLIRKGAYDQLLSWWSMGGEVQWSGLYPAIRPRRISLPTYPFMRERYWIPAEEKNSFPVPLRKDTPGWLREQLITIAANTIKRSREDISTELDFFDDGFDSISGAELIRNINEALQITMDFSVLFNNTNLTSLVAFIEERFETDLRIPAANGHQVTNN